MPGASLRYGFATNPALVNSAVALFLILFASSPGRAAKVSTTTKLSASPGSSNAGQSVTLTATVSPSKASGSVTFNDSGSPLGTSNITSGTATLPVTTLSVGTHSITAVYSGDSNYSGSTSAVVTATVGPPVTLITLKSSANPAGVGQSVTFSAALSPSSATGSVTFNDASTALGTSSVYLGNASITLSTLGIGTHSITAVYAGDSKNPGATSSALTQSVTQAKSTTTLTSSANPSGTSQSLTLTATVVPANATGNVTFNDGNTSLGSSALTAGVATLAVTTLAAGAHSLTAVYAGDTNDAARTSAVLKQTVVQGTTTTLSSSTNPASIGQSVTITAAITPATATGSVTFLDGNMSLGTGAVATGTASLAISTLSAGVHSLTAVYGGDKNDATSTSAVLTQTVTKASTTTTLSSSANPSTAGQSLTLTATVLPATATGSVTFKDGPNTLGSGVLSGGMASLTASALTIGAHSLTAAYLGDANDSPSTSSAFTQTVNQSPTTTTLVSSPNPSSFGQALSLSATVSPATATGLVTFKDSAQTLGSAALSSGMATFTASNLSSGTHSLTAVFGGDGADAPSTSAVVTQNVNQALTTLTLTTSANPSNYGQNITLSASVSPAAATGSVTFQDGSTTLGSSLLRNGVATLSVANLSSGTHFLTAGYGGDANDAASTSSPAAQTVNQANTTTTLNSSANPSGFGQNVTLTATVSPSSATGTITFQDAGATLGSGNLANGVASFPASGLTTGIHTLTAAYSGDANNIASTSAALNQVVRPAATTTTLSSSSNPVSYGQNVTLTATVAPVSATGIVTFQEGATQLGSSNLINGAATLVVNTLSTGPHSITASYSGDDNDAVSNSSPLTLTVRPAATTTSLSVSPNPSAYGQPLILTATVSAGSGTVTFQDGAVTLGTGTLSGSVATFTVSALSVGTHALTASYSGDANDAGSTSAPVSQTITPATPTVTLASAPNPSTPGQPVLLTATVSSGSGTVTFKEAATVLGSAQLANGSATLYLSSLAVGNHQLMAAYSGDTSDAPATSPAWTQTVAATATSTALTSTPNPSAPGQRVTLTATVSSGSGSVTFNDGSVALGTVNLTSGTASLIVTTLSVGIHALTAVYSGDQNNSTSTSPVLSQTVTAAPTGTTLTSSPNPSVSGQNVVLTATVSPPSVAGVVTFMDGAAQLGSSALANGTGVLTLATLPTGVRSLAALYSGDSNNAASTSAPLNQTVNGVIVPNGCVANFGYTIGQPVPSALNCAFAVISSASFTAAANAAWLQISPSAGTLSTSPTPLTISVDPTNLTAGTYSGAISVAGPECGSMTIPVQLVVSPAGSLLATPSALTLTYQQGAPSPLTLPLTISSTNGTYLPFTITSDSPWLTSTISAGTTPQPFTIVADPSALDTSSYMSILTVSSPGLPPLQVPVSLLVSPPSTPRLNVPTAPVNLTAVQGGNPIVVQLPVADTAVTPPAFTASATSSGWLAVSQSTPVIITADPTSLDPATYQGSITITTPDATTSLPVTLSVAPSGPAIQLSQTGLTFRTVAQGGSPLPQKLSILNSGTGTLPWTASASTVSGGPWLLLPPPGDSTQSVAIDPAVLATMSPGDYYGQIQITAPAGNSPQIATVVLTILPSGANPGPDVYPASLLFTGPDPQSITVATRNPNGDQFVSGSTGNGFTWSPASAILQPNQPLSLQVTPSGPGQETLTLQFSDGTVRTVNLYSPDPTTGCGTLKLQWRVPAQTYITVTQGIGHTLELQVTDSCGNPAAASVQATFSNGDAPLNLVPIGNGVWTGTWQPASTLSATITVIAVGASIATPGLAPPLFATVVPGSAPIITPDPVQLAPSMVFGTPIASGTLITLPRAAASTKILIGAESSPLFNDSTGLISVQVP